MRPPPHHRDGDPPAWPCSCSTRSWRAEATIADLVRRAGVVQDALRGGGIARLDVGHDPDVAVYCDTTFVFRRMGKVRGMRSKEASSMPWRCWAASAEEPEEAEEVESNPVVVSGGAGVGARRREQPSGGGDREDGHGAAAPCSGGDVDGDPTASRQRSNRHLDRRGVLSPTATRLGGTSRREDGHIMAEARGHAGGRGRAEADPQERGCRPVKAAAVGPLTMTAGPSS